MIGKVKEYVAECLTKETKEERKPDSFGSMIESMSWYTNMRKQFIKEMGLEEHK